MRWIVFGEDWGRHPSSTQHLFQRIAATDEVIWVNSMGLRSPRLSRHDFRRVLNKGLAMLSPHETVAHDTAIHETAVQKTTGHNTATGPEQPRRGQPKHQVQPRTLPFFGSALARRFNCYQLKKQLRALTADDQPTVLWISLPSAADLVGELGEDFAIYYCGDDFGSLAGVDHAVISAMEQQLARRCDLILTASERLAARFPADKTTLLEHGVDYTGFSQPQPRPQGFPEGPVMGFYGQLADWVDVDLLNRISEQHPNWTLMLIGAIHTDTGDLLDQPNVLWLDAIPHHQLAAYAQHWQIALLPFKPCDQITHCNPLKLREYLATGTEVVSLQFPAAERYRGHIRLATDAGDFLHQLAWSVQHPAGADSAPLRQQLVVADCWDRKSRELQQLAHRYTAGKTGTGQVCHG